MKDEHAIVLFDGVCNFCNRRVNFIIRNDKRDHFRFAALQSEIGKKILVENKFPENYSDSFILVENGKIHQRTSAVIRISKHLRFPWPMFYAFIIVPPFIRDIIYKIIAKNRYKWWGKREACMIPTAEVKNKFL